MPMFADKRNKSLVAIIRTSHLLASFWHSTISSFLVSYTYDGVLTWTDEYNALFRNAAITVFVYNFLVPILLSSACTWRQGSGWRVQGFGFSLFIAQRETVRNFWTAGVGCFCRARLGLWR